MGRRSPEEVCSRKRQFFSRSEAMKSKKKIARTFDKTYSVYRCDICGGWHLTTQDRDKRKHNANLSNETC